MKCEAELIGHRMLAVHAVNVVSLSMQGQQRNSALLEYFHTTGNAKIKAVVYVSGSHCISVLLIKAVESPVSTTRVDGPS